MPSQKYGCMRILILNYSDYYELTAEEDSNSIGFSKHSFLKIRRAP
jgi:hypothetical protein